MLCAERKKTVKVSSRWRKRLRLIPGYDCFKDAGDCWFDEDAAGRACEFFPTFLTHIEGDKAGQPFILEDWQKAIVGAAFGWKMKDSIGRVIRRYREVLIYVPKKNGKTPLIAGINILVGIDDDEAGQVNFCTAGDRTQAGYLFRWMKDMVANEPELNNRCEIFGESEGAINRTIVFRESGGRVSVISSKPTTKHGGNLHLITIDELFAQNDRDLVDALTTSMASLNRAQPLIIYITTADTKGASICNEIYDRACTVRDRPGRDIHFLPVIYEAGKKDDWRSERTWRKANPNLGISVSLDYLRGAYKKARSIASYENTFKRFHLNMQTESTSRWITSSAWDDCGERFDEKVLEGEPCIGGLDLSNTSTDGLTSLMLMFKKEDIYYLKPYFWIPADSVEELGRRHKGSNYPQWIRAGYLRTTPGNAIDHDAVRLETSGLRKVLGEREFEEKVKEYLKEISGEKPQKQELLKQKFIEYNTGISEIYEIRECAYDRWAAMQLVNQLTGDGLTMVEFGQGFGSMSGPTKEFERLLVAKKIRHNNNPVLAWMAGNVVVDIDAAKNYKPNKAKSGALIDGIVTAIMCLGRWMANIPTASVYETRGLLTL
jgi:phage terminase large subunit-like protein